jgi:Outer membrane protein beta-barrel domain
MRKLLYAVLLLLSVQTLNAQGRLGVKAGGNLSLVNSKLDKTLDFDNPGVGWAVGLYYKIPMSSTFSIQAELNYSSQQAQETYYFSKVQLNYVQVPVLFQVHPGGKNFVLFAGPQLNFLSNSKLKLEGEEEVKDNARFVQTDLGVSFGLGTRPKPGHFGFDVRAFKGMTNVFKAPYVNGNKSRNTLLTVSVLYAFGKK